VKSLARANLHMKTIPIIISLACVVLAACSRSEKQDTAVSASPTPNSTLQRDAERLQQATAKIAKERERAAQSSPVVSPAP
jgi:uncharacterized protein YaaN involved in tellurite resistance